MRKLLLLVAGLATSLTAAMLVLQLWVPSHVPGDHCLACIWEELADLRLYMFLLFCEFGGLVAAIIPDSIEPYVHVVSEPLYDLFCDFGGLIDSVISGESSDGSVGQEGTGTVFY